MQRLLRPLLSLALEILRPGGRVVFLFPGFVRPSDTPSHATTAKAETNSILNRHSPEKIDDSAQENISPTENHSVNTKSEIESRSLSPQKGKFPRPHVRKLLLQPEWLWLVEWGERGLILDSMFTQTFANIRRHCVCLTKT